MRALLLAAGLGTRLRPLTEKTPKCLVPIHGKPLLAYWLDVLRPEHIEAILINTSYLAEQVREFVRTSGSGQRVTLVHEDQLLGTGGTVLANRNFFGNEPFLLAHADNLTRFDVGGFIARHRSRPVGTLITMMTFKTDQPQNCGIVEQDERGIVRAFHEKVPHPPGDEANAAVYIFEPQILDFLASLPKPVIDLSTEVIPHFVGRICTYPNRLYHRDIGNLESLRRAEAEFPRS